MKLINCDLQCVFRYGGWAKHRTWDGINEYARRLNFARGGSCHGYLAKLISVTSETANCEMICGAFQFREYIYHSSGIIELRVSITRKKLNAIINSVTRQAKTLTVPRPSRDRGSMRNQLGWTNQLVDISRIRYFAIGTINFLGRSKFCQPV